VCGLPSLCMSAAVFLISLCSQGKHSEIAAASRLHAGCSACCSANSVKALKTEIIIIIIILILILILIILVIWCVGDGAIVVCSTRWICVPTGQGNFVALLC